MTKSKDFKDFSEQDLIHHPYFQDWILSPDEEKDSFWQNFLTEYPEKKQAVENAGNLLKAIAFKESWPAEEKVERSLKDAFHVISTTGKKASARLIPVSGSLYRTWLAAAAVLVLIAFSWWLVADHNRVKKPSVAVSTRAKDIAPGGNKAILTLADGSQVVLDTAGNGAITKQGSITVIKLDNGQLAYNKEGTGSTAVLYNTITTPRGGQYQLVLADGSKVWLNAASSLRFPIAFTGKERRVELTGEGYFEVAHDVLKPFHVTVNNMDVQVLGTHFNINSYSDEPAAKTTLLEGRVMIKKNEKLVYLNPGQQAILPSGQDNIRVDYHADVEEAVAWKNGLFIFNNTPLEDIMRQIERWYNVDVVYQGNIPQDTFNGNISRNTNLSEVLKVLEYSNIRFRVEGNTITVLPQ
jgi:ferric-dicitrate binding protein FerR (iron transport regulator)